MIRPNPVHKGRPAQAHAKLLPNEGADKEGLTLNLHGSWPDGELVGFDLETTGVDPLSARPVSYAFATIIGGELISHRNSLVQPGIPIPPEAVAVHGITNAMVAIDGLAIDDALDRILDALFDSSNRGVPLVGMNLSYDLSLIDTLLRARDAVGLRERGGMRQFLTSP